MNLKTCLVLVVFAVGCSSAPPPRCVTNQDCLSAEVCTSGGCVATQPPPADCTVGQTRPCGPEPVGACRKGTQRCVSGKFETACLDAITPAAETCNGLDDDCDGTIDNGAAALWFIDADGDGYGSASGSAQKQLACAKPSGFAATASDCDDASALVHPGATEQCAPAGTDENCNGTVDEGCGCPAVGQTQPCCAGRGVQTCEGSDAGTSLSSCSVTPSNEVCNGIDDDCDGQVDDQVALGNADGGILAIDGGATGLANGTCRIGTGICLASGVTSCGGGALVCSAAAGTAQTETCNGLDDDCDGQVDEAGAGLCTVTGQVCTTGSCACPSGQAICNGACATLSTEVCDGLDNDCDGQVDEALTIACAGDPDGDGYASSSTTTQQCPAAGGACPTGQVAPAQSLGLDCNPANAAVYRLVASRSDADTDGSCVGATVSDCVGATALTGRRFAASCAAVDDCNDLSAAVYRTVPSRSDTDGDSYCTGATANDCVGAAALPGRRFAVSCTATDDCNDSSAAVYLLALTRSDADNDAYCTGASVSTCVGAAAPAGRRFPVNCVADDCNDANSNLFQLASVRTDADNDGWCSNVATTQCIGSSAPAGSRLTANCLGDDCRDTNSQATSACTLSGAYATNSHTQTCPNGPQTFTLNVVSFCPLGFTVAGTYVAQKSSGNGNCSANSETSITQSCNFLEGSVCRIVGDCVALPTF